MRAGARQTGRHILPWGSGRAGGAEAAYLFKVQTSYVNLLPVCISLERPCERGAEMESPLCAGALPCRLKWR